MKTRLASMRRLISSVLVRSGVIGALVFGLRGWSPSAQVAPALFGQGGERVVLPGATVILTANVSGTPPLSFQWLFNDAPLSFETNRSLTLTGVQASQTGSYGLIVTNNYGVTTGAVAHLMVLPDPPPTVAGGWGLNDFGQILAPTDLFDVRSIHAGLRHVLALKGDGSVVAWGNNAYQQLNIPTGLTNATELAAGAQHSLGLRSDGTVFAWGDNSAGQSAVPPGLSNVVAIAAGGFHSLALSGNGTVVAWGNNSYGQGAAPPGMGNPIALSAGGYFSVALLGNGRVVAWGFNGNKQTNAPPMVTNAIAISAGFNHCLALRNDGTVVAWGYSGSGQTNVPAGLSNVVAVAAGFNHSLALKADGTVVGWGNNASGQINPPVTMTQIVAITAGNSFNVAITPAPFIRTAPADHLLILNSNAIFAVEAVSVLPVNFQWLFNGTNLAGATNSLLTVFNSQPADAGSYSVMVSNLYGAVFSAAAVLSAAPAIQSPPTNQIGQIGSNALFGAAVISTAPVTYQWQFQNANIPGAMSATFTRLNAQPVHVGDYRVVVSSSVGSVTSAPAWLSLVSSNQSARIGDTVSLSITSSLPLAFQWQFDNGNLVGQTNRSISLTNLQLSQSGTFRVLADDGTNSLASPDIAVTVFSLPAITNSPVNQTVVLGSTATFAAGASGTAPLTYQWFLNNTRIKLATNPVLTIVNAQASHAGSYKLFVTNYAGSATSAPVTLTLNYPPSLTTPPVGQSVPAGTNVVMNVTATGTLPLSFQWLFNSQVMAGANTNSLSLTNVQAINAGNYQVIVGNAYGLVTSSIAPLAVLPSAPAILSEPESRVVIAGANATFSVFAAGLEPMDYRWQFNNVDVPEATHPILTLTNIQHAHAGQFQVVVHNSEGSVTSSVATLTVYPGEVGTIVTWPPTWRQSTMPTGLCEVVAIAYDLALKRDGKVLSWGSPTTVPANLPPLAALSGISDSVIGLKNDGTVIAWGNDGGGYHIDPPVWLKDVVSIAKGNLAVRSDGTVVGWGEGMFSPQGAVLPIDNVATAMVGQSHWLALKRDGTVAAFGDNSYGQTDVPAGLAGVKAITCGTFHSLALRSNGTVVAWGMNAYGQCTVPPGLNGIKAIGCGYIHSFAVRSNGTLVAWGRNEEGQCNVPAGLSNVIAVTGAYADNLALKAVNLGITTQPVGATNLAGSNVTFSVAAYSSTPVTYQWFHNNVPLAGATKATLTLTNIQPLNIGNYTVQIKNSEAMCESEPARLAVVPWPFLPFPSGTSGRVVAWGRNIYGETNVPPGLSNVVAVSSGCGSFDSFAYQADGTIVRWGGGVGLPGNLSNLVHVAGGANYNLGLNNNGTLSIWGLPDYTYLPPDVTGVRAISVGGPKMALRTDGVVMDLGGSGLLEGVSNATAIAAGSYHALALLKDGTLVLSLNNYLRYSEQTPLPPAISNVVAIAAGSDHCLALRTDGTVIAWGKNSDGQCSVPVGLSNVVAIAAAGHHSLALKADHTVVPWGDNAYGMNEPPLGLTNIIAIACGWSHNVALRAGPVFTSVPTNVVAAFGTTVTFQVVAEADSLITYQWLFNRSPIAGATNAVLILTNVQVRHAGDYTLHATADGFTTLTDARLSFGIPPVILAAPADVWVRLGDQAVFRVQATNAEKLLYQWSNGNRILLGETNDTLIITNVQPELAGAYRVRVSTLCAQETNVTATLSVLSPKPMGSVIAWESTTNVPPGLSGIIQVAAGESYSVALRADGTVVEWDNASGSYTSIPSNPTQVISIAVGNYHTLALRRDGTIVGWGFNYNGQASPPGISDAVAVAAAHSFSAALRRNGTAVVWGNGSGGVLNIPANATNLAAIAAGSDHLLALRNDGTVVGWGSLVPPAGLSNIIAIAAGNQNSMALRSDGRVFCWGISLFGETNVPPDLSSVAAIAMGYSRCLALFPNGTVRGWGSAIPPSNLSNLVAIAAGDYTSLAVRQTGVFIVKQPQSLTVLAGTNATLSLEAVGISPLTYQWKLNGTNISGATAPSLTLANVPDTHEGVYTVSVFSSVGEELSVPARLTVLSPPRFLVPPESQAILAGSNVTFWTHAIGTAPLSYQWLSNGVTLTGEAATNLTLTNLTWLGTNSYQVRVTNIYGAMTSAPALLTVISPPVILAPPANRNVVVNSNTTFTISAFGTAPLAYRWQFNERDIPEATNDFIDITNAQPDSAGDYRVVVTNVFGAVTSAPAMLTVLPLSPTIVASPANQSVAVGSTASFAVVATGAAPINFQWQRDGIALPGRTGTTLDLINVQGSDVGAYDVVVTNSFGTVTSAPARLEVLPNPNVVAWGLNDRGQTNVPAQLTNVVAVSAGFRHTLALRGDGTVTGWGTNDFGQLDIPPGLSNVVAVAAGYYHNLALRSDGTVVDWGANTFGESVPPAGLTNVIAIAAGSSQSLALKNDGTVVGWGYNVYGQARPPADLTNAIAIAAGQEHSIALRSNGTIAAWGYYYGDPTGISNVVAIAGKGYHFLLLRSDGTIFGWGSKAVEGPTQAVVISAGGRSGFGQAHNLAILRNGTVSAWGDNTYGQASPPAGLSNVISIAAGYDFSVAVEGGAEFMTQPVSQTVFEGESAVFSAEVYNFVPTIFQWQVNGTDIVSATNNTLFFPSAQFAQHGSYALIASNRLGITRSAVATLTVIPPVPGLTASPANQTVVAGDTAVFSVSAVGVTPLMYQWRFNGFDIPGATGTSLTISNTASHHIGAYSVVVRNPNGAVESAPVALMVVPPDLIVDNLQAQISGAWGLSASGSDKFSTDYRFTSQGPGTSSVNFVPTILQTGVYEVYEWHPQSFNRSIAAPYFIEYDGGTHVAFLNQKANGGRWNLLGTFPFAAGAVGRVRISDAFPDAGQTAAADAIKFVYVAPPLIVIPPQSQFVMVGGSADFRVAAASPSPLSFQWQKDNNDLPAATLDRLHLANVHLADAGIYRVTIRNAGGSTTSAATLDVGAPVTISGSTGSAILSWAGPFVLQTATDIVGPYIDVPRATSPWVLIITDEPQRFFRLRFQ